MTKIAFILCAVVLLAYGTEAGIVSTIILARLNTIASNVNAIVTAASEAVEEKAAEFTSALETLTTLASSFVEAWITEVATYIGLYESGIASIQEAVGFINISECVVYTADEFETLADETWSQVEDCIATALENVGIYAEAFAIEVAAIGEIFDNLVLGATSCIETYEEDPSLAAGVTALACVNSALLVATSDSVGLLATFTATAAAAIANLVSVKVQLKTCGAAVAGETLATIVADKLETYQNCVTEIIASVNNVVA